MCRYRMGNPKRMSRFICLNCLKENMVGIGIQRSNQREKGHIKDLMCINKGCEGITTKNLEVRFCDDYLEMIDKAYELHNVYYGENNKRRS